MRAEHGKVESVSIAVQGDAEHPGFGRKQHLAELAQSYARSMLLLALVPAGDAVHARSSWGVCKGLREPRSPLRMLRAI